MDHTSSPGARRQYAPWSLPADALTVARRAGGRRRYNRTRAFRAAMRRNAVLRFLAEDGFTYGAQERAARALGVSVSTISRDVQRLRTQWLRAGGIVWPIDLRIPKAAARLMERLQH